MNTEIEDMQIEEEDLIPEEVITQPFSPSDISLSTPPMNLGDLIDMIEHGWINFGTSYQREQNLWDDVKQSRLIESVLLGLRLPAFYFEEVSKKKWNIIDGLQRCCAIRNFCVDGSLELSSLEFLSDRFNGSKYENFNFEIKRDIRMLPITVNVLSKGVPDMVKYILFKRLNTGGIELTPQEIRNAVFQGQGIDTIEAMAHDEAFLEATCCSIETRRKTDMDFVSRFVTFYVKDWHDYNSDMETFINECMLDLRDNATTEYLQNMKSDFHDTMVLVTSVFGNRAFRKQTSMHERRRPLNKAFFESLGSVVARRTPSERQMLLSNKKLFVSNMMNAMNDSNAFFMSFSGATGRKDTVIRRFSTIEQIVNDTLRNKKTKLSNYDN